MRILGRRKEQRISFHASAQLLESGIRFNDEMHSAFPARNGGVARGVYRFASHQAANEHQEQCIAEEIAMRAIERNKND